METETEERKESWSEDCMKALAALTNTRGGTLWIGIKDDGSVIGWDSNGKQQEAISNQIVNSLHIHPASVSVEQKAGKSVLAIQMHQAAAPVALRGRYYRRVGNSSRELPAEELPRFLLERTGQTWDALPAEEGIEGMAVKTVEDFKVLAHERLPELAPSDMVEAILGKLKLTLPERRVKRAAYLLFGEDPQRLTPTAQVQIGRFKDEETILDDKRIEGNLFQQISQVEQLLRNYFFIRYEFPSRREGQAEIGAMQREEIWEFPYKAIREAVINALIHRDYTSTGRVQIRVYDDRMVISNPGGLPAGLMISDLLREPHDSLPRNPILAQVCYYAKLVEQWGSGTIRMRNACRTQGLPDPIFESTATAFTVTLRKDDLSEERL
ncbi:MAG: putative DNA binding domain-containing protein [Armatimonadota bacterium]|nr:putative DNA binding domain-containing protein [Armatimonadota bacterium]